MDNVVVAAVVGAAGVFGGAISAYLSGRRTATATEKTAALTTQTSKELATSKTLSDRIEFMLNRADKVETDLRKSIEELSNRVFALEKEREEMLKAHGMKEREWNECKVLMEAAARDLQLKFTLLHDQDMEKARTIVQLMDTQSRLMDTQEKLAGYIAEHDPAWNPGKDDAPFTIGDIEILRLVQEGRARFVSVRRKEAAAIVSTTVQTDTVGDEGLL